jgi:hypothetical protein
MVLDGAEVTVDKLRPNPPFSGRWLSEMTDRFSPMQKSPPAPNPEAYLASLSGWHRRYVEALRSATLSSAPLRESIKWGHLVYHSNGPALLIRAEPTRVLFGFWRGQRLRHIEPRLKPGGKYEMATLELVEETPLEQPTVVKLVQEAVALNAAFGDPTSTSPPKGNRAP